ncbi:hypothetical protein NA56DRAFT_345844 [Hyaloscypha hepaticicola]|uniref:Uncharacterized protein n=1 Tax=Hyaloscypha hepaticicola TaxID=2082293 RepID=A0A2J6QJM8_9HELO|nr:hypothetical protein NA56DRAFT_345844 [Hyaloscypha hepaticicola]
MYVVRAYCRRPPLLTLRPPYEVQYLRTALKLQRSARYHLTRTGSPVLQRPFCAVTGTICSFYLRMQQLLLASCNIQC